MIIIIVITIILILIIGFCCKPFKIEPSQGLIENIYLKIDPHKSIFLLSYWWFWVVASPPNGSSMTVAPEPIVLWSFPMIGLA